MVGTLAVPSVVRSAGVPALLEARVPSQTGTARVIGSVSDRKKPVTGSVSFISSITRHRTKANVLVVHKRMLTFKDGVLVKMSQQAPTEEIPVS
jgi:hypothetical protein